MQCLLWGRQLGVVLASLLTFFSQAGGKNIPTLATKARALTPAVSTPQAHIQGPAIRTSSREDSPGWKQGVGALEGVGVIGKRALANHQDRSKYVRSQCASQVGGRGSGKTWRGPLRG